jgi:hypothetical protein
MADALLAMLTARVFLYMRIARELPLEAHRRGVTYIDFLLPGIFVQSRIWPPTRSLSSLPVPYAASGFSRTSATPWPDPTQTPRTP